MNLCLLIILDTDEASQEVNTLTLPPTAEEVLLEAMDSYNNDEPSLLQRSVKTNNTDETNTKEQTTSAGCTTEDASVSDDNNIIIKLKFINDDQKQVTGSLKEMLGEFKR